MPGGIPELILPQLATPVETPPPGGDWIHEVKFDGYRLCVRVADGVARAFTRSGLNWTKRFPTLIKESGKLDVADAWIDGELVKLDGDGASDFSALQAAIADGKDADLVFYAFDLMWLNGVDLRRKTQVERKRLLKKLVLKGGKSRQPHIRYSDEFGVEGKAFLQAACRLALEGIVSKRKSALYRSDRNKNWLKSKCQLREEFVIGGYTDSTTGAGIGSLLLGHREGRDLVYDGRVGTGFSQRVSVALKKKLLALKRGKMPFVEMTRQEKRGARWVKPELVCEVRYGSRTADDRIRHATFLDLRVDKPAAAVIGEAGRGDDTVAGVTISHPGRVIDPSTGTTKLQLAQFYQLVGDRILREIDNRPVSLVRCPEGISGGHFFQRHPPQGMAERVHSVPESPDPKAERLIWLSNLTELITAVQFGAIEIHPWGAQVSDLDKTDRLVFDLDPDEALPFSVVIEAAKVVRRSLEQLGLECFLKTTGGKGLHVVAPIKPAVGWSVAKPFARAIALDLAQRTPEAFTANMAKARRRNRIFIDYLRNDRTSTAIAAYAARARPGLGVAWPVSWDKATAKLDPADYTVGSITKGLLRPDPWKRMAQLRQTITKAALKKMKVEK